MKKSIIYFFVIFAFCSISCNADMGGVENPSFDGGLVFSKSQEKLSAKEKNFEISLFRNIIQKEKGKNTMISPFSASLCLSAISAGSEGETRDEIVSAMGLGSSTDEEIAAYYNAIVNNITDNKDMTVTVANAIWSRVPLKKEYTDFVSEKYGSSVYQIEKSDDMNQSFRKWIDTEYSDSSLFSNNNFDETVVALANLMTIDGEWSTGKMSSYEGEFTNVEGVRSDCRYIKSKARMLSCFDKNVESVSIPLAGGKMSFIVLKPVGGKSFDDFAQSLTARKWSDWIEKMNENNVVYSIPVFSDSFESSDSFKAALENMGIESAFSSKAAFNKMSDVSLYVSTIIQSGIMKVDENGISAAASTLAEMKYTGVSDPNISYREFVADSPFVYAVVENSKHTLLLLGTHVN